MLEKLGEKHGISLGSYPKKAHVASLFQTFKRYRKTEGRRLSEGPTRDVWGVLESSLGISDADFLS
jgi:hypothetical protein